jgi:hypothetical protein
MTVAATAGAGQGHTETGQQGTQTGTQTGSTTGEGTGTGQQTGTAGATGAAGTTGAAATGTGQQAGAQGTQSGQPGTAGAQQETPKAPATYALQLPASGRLSERHRTQIEAMARANDWSNDDAQAAVNDLDAQLAAETAGWLEDTKKDKDYGGEKLAESQRLGKLAVDRIRPAGHARRDAFLRLLDSTGYGNHVEVVAFFADLGKLMGEDPGAGGSGSRVVTSTREDRMYDHPTSKKLAGQT